MIIGKIRASAALKTENNDSLLLIDCPDCILYKNINKDDDLKNIYEKDKNIFYKIAVTKDEIRNSYEEYGIAELTKKQNNIFLKRKNCFHYIEDGQKVAARAIPEITVPSDHKIIVSSFLPEDYRHLFTLPNSVICSEDPFSANPVELEENSLLGRLDDRLQSIDQNELWNILLNNTKKPVKGSIRYNDKDECFEGYNGKQWRALMWGEK
jgi:hypothetical protein